MKQLDGIVIEDKAIKEDWNSHKNALLPKPTLIR